MMKLASITLLLTLLLAGISSGEESLNLARVGSLQSWRGESVVVNDNYAFVAAGPNGLRILDVENPAMTYEASYLRLPGIASGITLGEDVAYVATGWGGISKVDLADMEHPLEVSYYNELNGSAVCVGVSGSRIYAGYAADGVVVLEDRGEEGLVAVAHFEQGNAIAAIAVEGDLLAVTGPQIGTTLYRIDEDAEPSPIGEIEESFVDVKILATRLVGCTANSIKCFVISDPSAPSLASAFSPVNLPSDIAFSSDGRQLLAACRDGWRLFSLSQNGGLELLFNVQPENMMRGVAFSGRTALLLPGAGMDLYNVADPHNSEQVGMACSMGGVLGIEKVGDYAVGIGGVMSVIDVSYPSRPVLLSTTPLPGSADPLKFIDNLVYVPCEDLRIYDISNPRAPALLGTIQPLAGMNYRDVDVEGGLAALINQDNLFVVDVADPHHMRLLGHEPTANNMFFINVDFVGDLIYAASNSGTFVFDASDPRYINRIGLLDGTSNGSFDVHVDGSIAYVSGGPYYQNSSCLQIIDVADPRNSVLLGSCELPAAPRSITKMGDWIYVADNWAGIQAIDVSDPERPYRVGFWTEEYDNYYGVAAFDRFVIGADRYKGLSIFENSFAPDVASAESAPLPTETTLSSFPNPFNATTSINYTLQQPGRFAIDVVDIRGRFVARLDEGFRSAGSYNLLWNADKAASGTYRIVLNSGAENRSMPVVLIK